MPRQPFNVPRRWPLSSSARILLGLFAGTAHPAGDCSITTEAPPPTLTDGGSLAFAGA